MTNATLPGQGDVAQRILEMMREATRLLAAGFTYNVVAEKLGMTC